MLTFLRHLRYGWCRHKHLERIKLDGVWHFRCVCGYQVPIVARTADELARARRLLGGA
jgi:hypothetical protein